MYNMQRIIHIPMSPEFTLHIAIAQNPHLGVKFLAVHAENATVELQRREQSQGLREAGFGAEGGWRGETAGGRGGEAEKLGHVDLCFFLSFLGLFMWGVK